MTAYAPASLQSEKLGTLHLRNNAKAGSVVLCRGSTQAGFITAKGRISQNNVRVLSKTIFS